MAWIQIPGMDPYGNALREFSEFMYPHASGNRYCSDCWDSRTWTCKCGGQIHQEFGDENYDGDYWLWDWCDRCGADYQFADDR